ncbi:ATP-binding protein [Streptomyces sp. NPDC060194]|uniref:ATP-binding protein n=1 Tax=Streptomyces sp. NPDC060194 TaxID=3347069 RepID=UPI00365BCD1C
MGTNGSTMLEPLRRQLPPLDVGDVDGSASCALPARLDAVRGARRFTHETLEGWGLGERFDDVSLVVSELVTNALRHAVTGAAANGGSPEAGCPRSEPEPPVRLHLMRWSERLVCAVRDPSEVSPEPRREDEDFAAECGRGLFLVDSFSDSWGWHPLVGSRRGKVVWALFRV